MRNEQNAILFSPRSLLYPAHRVFLPKNEFPSVSSVIGFRYQYLTRKKSLPFINKKTFSIIETFVLFTKIYKFHIFSFDGKHKSGIYIRIYTNPMSKWKRVQSTVKKNINNIQIS